MQASKRQNGGLRVAVPGATPMHDMVWMHRRGLCSCMIVELKPLYKQFFPVILWFCGIVRRYAPHVIL